MTNAIDWLAEKLGLKPRPYVPPYIPPVRYNVPAPVPVSQPAPLTAQPQPQASLVSSVDHPRGRGHTGSLISGR